MFSGDAYMNKKAARRIGRGIGCVVIMFLFGLAAVVKRCELPPKGDGVYSDEDFRSDQQKHANDDTLP
jgi:hypothetical protein